MIIIQTSIIASNPHDDGTGINENNVKREKYGPPRQMTGTRNLDNPKDEEQHKEGNHRIQTRPKMKLYTICLKCYRPAALSSDIGRIKAKKKKIGPQS